MNAPALVPGLDEYRRRRERIAPALGEDVLILFGGEERLRSNDTEYRFRPDSDFFYLTGLVEPGAVLVFRPGRVPATVLFVRPRDRDAEIWTGRRVGPEGATARYGADEAHPVGALAEQLPSLLDGVGTVHMPLGLYPDLQRAVWTAIERLRRRNRWGETPPEAIREARVILGEDRIVKDDAALASLRRAVDISAEAHLAAMRRVRPGLHEYEIEAILEYEFRRRGSSGPGYGTIVGTGDNATILHYVENRDRLEAGQLLLVDAGAEWNLFCADITRTYPVSGAFTPAQRALYEIVLAANRAGIEGSFVGADIDAIHHTCLRILVEGLIDIGLLSGTVDAIVEDESYKRFYMHRTSHWLGADVHDAGYYCIDRKPRPLGPGFVLTIEPGLYVAADEHDVPAEFRGCGVRIEDDVLVGREGPEVLTYKVPKTIEDLEAIVGSEP